MFLLDKLKYFVQTPRNEDIKAMRDESDLLSMHYFGSNIVLNQITGFEDEEQLALRKKLKISNEPLLDRLLRPADIIWSTRGGSFIVQLNEDKKTEFLEELNDVRDGMNIKSFMRDIWWERLIVDPNGIIQMEIPKDPKNKKPYLTFKSINYIRHYESSGIDVEYICFEPEKTIIEKEGSKSTIETFRIIDKEYYYEIVVKDNKEITEDNVFMFKNTLGFVPCIINSTLINTLTNSKNSPVSRLLDLFNAYLRKMSVKEYYENFHAFPVYFEVESVCGSCGGLRVTKNGEPCPVCKGSGRAIRKLNKAVTDVLWVKREDDKEVPYPKDWAGYYTPPSETEGNMRTDIEWIEKLCTNTLWGNTIEEGKNETATGKFINTQPKNSMLTVLSTIEEDVETKLVNFFGHYYFSNWENGKVINGKRFIIEPPDAIWKKYETAKEKKMPFPSLDSFLEQYYLSEYFNDRFTSEYYIKLMKIEPYVHMTIDEVVALPIDETIKRQKIYFNEWKMTVPMSVINENTIEQSIELLIKFINTKNYDKINEPKPEGTPEGQQGVE